MTENNPGLPDNAGGQQEPGSSEHGGWHPASPQATEVAGQQARDAGGTNPWAAPAEAQGHGGGYQQHFAGPGQPGMYGQGGGGYAQGHSTATYPAVPPRQGPRQGGVGKLIAGVAVLALLVGGTAGGIGGYLASDHNSSPVVNSLDAPKPMDLPGGAAPAGTVESAAEKLSPSTVQLQVSGRSGAGEGSGFVISTDGYVMTNNHVVEVAAAGGQIRAVFQDGRKAPASIVGRDPTTDIAVVKVSGAENLKPVELGGSGNLRVGQGVVAVGSPFELAGTVTSGIVSALHRPVTAGGAGDQTTVMDAVQTDAAINPGNSGGPLGNLAGQVIGINSAIYSPQSGSGGMGQASESGNVGIGFAIPIDQARRTANDIIKTGKAVQTFMGATVGNAPDGGAQIGDVQPGSPAEQAGLKSGDVVVKLDDRLIENANALVAAIRTRAPGDKVKLTLADNRVLEVTLGGQPVEVK
jgi:putative serine protease PepD